METFLRDLRLSVRMLGKRPGFTAVVLVTLALGVGANTAVFSFVSGVLLHPLPYPRADRISMVFETWKGADRLTASPPNFRDWQEGNQVFESMAAWQLSSLDLVGEGDPERVVGASATADLFRVMGVDAALGRTFNADEDRPDAPPVVVLGHGFWARRFASDPGVVGRTLELSGRQYTVIGVMPPGFHFPAKAEVWVPRVFREDELAEPGRKVRYVRVVARLRDGVSPERAQSAMSLLARQLGEAHPEADQGWGINLVPLREDLVGDVRKTLLVLLGAVGFVLLVACANVVNLLLAHGTVRQREIALRLALGADRRRLLRQLLTESLVFSLVGGALGLLSAVWGTRALVALAPGDLPRLAEVGVDGRVLVFALVVAVVAGLLSGLLPAFRALPVSLAPSLREGDVKSAGGARHHRLRTLLVMAESALVLVLLVGAGLMIQSFRLLHRVDPGFQASERVALRVILPSSRYPEPFQQARFFEEVLGRLGSAPGVLATGAVTTLPLKPALGYYSYIDGRPEPKPGEEPTAGYDSVSPGYFRAMGIPLLEGRLFDERDRQDAPGVLVINRAMAEEYWPGEDPLGKRVSFESPHGPWVEVVGVVGDVKHPSLDSDPKPAMYYPYLQGPWRSMYLVLHVAAGRESLAVDAARRAVWAVDKQQPIAEVLPLASLLDASVSRPRFNMVLLSLFAVVALLLASAGIYGVVAYSVAQRRREIGVRMALGARRGDVLRLMLVRGLTPVLIGLALGIVAAGALGRLLSSLLFEVSASDPLVFATVALLLAVVGLLAVYVPSRRAATVDPANVLKTD